MAYDQQTADLLKQVESLKEQIKCEQVAVKGANERARMLLDAKNYWAAKYTGLRIAAWDVLNDYKYGNHESHDAVMAKLEVALMADGAIDE